MDPAPLRVDPAPPVAATQLVVGAKPGTPEYLQIPRAAALSVHADATDAARTQAELPGVLLCVPAVRARRWRCCLRWALLRTIARRRWRPS